MEDKRRQPRQARRLACELWLEGRLHTGIVRDVSAIGLFVQTRLRAEPDTELELVFRAEGNREEIRAAARVARQNTLSAHFDSSGTGGLGLEVLEDAGRLAPLLEDAGFQRAPAQAADAQLMRPFRVRLKQVQGGRSQMVAVRAPSLQSARARALHRAGRGWKVSEVLEG